MSIRVAKDFRFEAAHRLPWHEGACANLHGHSYHVTVAVTGQADERGMVVDFKRIKALVQPLIDEWDHSVLVAATDEDLRAAAESLGSRYTVLPGDTTAENLASYVADFMLRNGAALIREHRITHLRISVRETSTSEATLERHLDESVTPPQWST